MSQMIINEFKIDRHETTIGDILTYGFCSYRQNGYSMPKGFLTSYNAYHYVESNETNIEFSIQSPTGDSSDHHHFRFPCRSWEQAKWIVDQQFVAHETMLDEYEDKQS